MTENTQPDHDASMRFSARGNTRWIIVRGVRGQIFDQFLVRHTGFSIITWQYAKAGGNAYLPSLLMTTIGKRSGRQRTKVLPYYPDGDHDHFVVMGSNGGGPKDPDWVHNLRANPIAWVRVRRRDLVVDARVAEGAERERLVAVIDAQRDSLRRYEARAATFGREVPIVVLTPRRG